MLSIDEKLGKEVGIITFAKASMARRMRTTGSKKRIETIACLIKIICSTNVFMLF